MRIHFFQHVPFEGPGYIQIWADHRGAVCFTTAFYQDDPLPALPDLDWLVVMGGPMNIYEEDRYPWLAKEKAFIRAAVDAGKKVVGICLGAQLIADVLGGKVYPNKIKEIGWFPVTCLQEDGLFRGMPEGFMALHWHGDTFSLPEGAWRAAESAACLNQAFTVGQQVLALQFHLEAMPRNMNNLLTHCAGELVEGSCIQSAETIQRLSGACLEESNRLMCRLLDNLADGGE